MVRLLSVELLIAVLLFLAELPDLLACSRVSRALHRAASAEGAWLRGWTETVRGKVCVPAPAQKLADAGQYLSALRCAVPDAARTAITPAELTELPWEGRAKGRRGPRDRTAPAEPRETAY